MKKLNNNDLGRKSPEEYADTQKLPLIVVLDNIRSMNNIGSIFRTCDAFLVKSLYLCGITAKPPHKDIHKTALGAENTVNWKYFPKTAVAIHELKKTGYVIISCEQTDGSAFLHNFEPVSRTGYAVVFGHEVKGVGDEIIQHSDFCIEIPQFGTKHSLNISVAAGIIIWDLSLKLSRIQ
ncbi:MAG: RNA methyltransferase [Bacteroidota bacterium]